jgi:hypothetical protein
VLFQGASFEVAVVSRALLGSRLEHHLTARQSRVLRHLSPAWTVQVHLLSRALKRPVAHLKTLLALLGALHVLPIANTMRHILLVTYFNMIITI